MFWGYLATSGAKSDVIFLLGDPEISPLSRLVIEIPILGYLGVLGVWGYVPTSDAKSDVIFLLGDPDFLLGRRNFAPISLSYREPHFGLFGFLGVLGATRLSELTQN